MAVSATPVAGAAEPAPAPAPAPLTTPPTAPTPAPPTPPAADGPSISGAVLASTFLSSINVLPPPGVASVGNDQIGIAQYQLNDQAGGVVVFGNAIAASSSNNSGHPFPGMTLKLALQLSGEGASLGFEAGAELLAQTTPEGSPYTFPLLTIADSWNQNISPATTPKLISEEGALRVAPQARIVLNRTLHTWKAQNGAWFVELHVGSETADTFTTCWNVRLSSVDRQSCYAWDMDGDLRGAYISDNSDGSGAIVYRRDFPARASAAAKASSQDPYGPGNRVYRHAR